METVIPQLGYQKELGNIKSYEIATHFSVKPGKEEEVDRINEAKRVAYRKAYELKEHFEKEMEEIGLDFVSEYGERSTLEEMDNRYVVPLEYYNKYKINVTVDRPASYGQQILEEKCEMYADFIFIIG